MDLWTRLAAVQDRWNVLEHPFYERWSRGGLTRGELGRYAGQYRHAVVALADASAAAARAAEGGEREALAAHAREEAAHIDLWDGFAAAVGAPVPAAAEPETVSCARAWAGPGRDLAGHLVALYAIESAQPAISRVKAAGLREHYGVPAGRGTAYFDVHAERDVAHAAEARELLAGRLGAGAADRLAAEAERVLRANWELLDGVERRCGRPAA